MKNLFEKKISPEPNTGCWLWTGAVDPETGYGKFNDGKNRRAHRESWSRSRGEIPAGKWVLHKCDNRICVNPDHLFLGTHADNVRDMVAKGRNFAGPALAATMRRVAARGDQHYAMKVSAADRVAFHEQIRAGVSQADLARKYGISSALACRIAKGAWS